MSNSIQNLVQIPQNDQQLNLLVNAMNKAYGKYFNFETGAKKSNNLRDCYCESIGFTNGAYRQLQAYWSASTAYDFSDLNKNSVALLDDSIGGYNAVISMRITTQFIEYLCDQFPVNDDGFLTEDQLYDENFNDGLKGKHSDNKDASWESYGWGYLHHDNAHQLIVSQHKSKGEWFPLYYGNIIVGFAFSKKYAQRINGLLISAKQDKALNIDSGTNNQEWNDYISSIKENDEIQPGKYLSLRMASMKGSLYIPFDEVLIDDSQIIVTLGTEDTILTYNRQDDMVTYDGIDFDFASFYYFGKEQKTIKLSQGVADTNGHVTFPKEKILVIEFAEWFPESRIEYRLENGDDIDAISYVSQSTYLIS